MDFQPFKQVNSRDKCLSYMTDCEHHILAKAALISESQSLNENEDEGYSLRSAVTSTPDCQRNTSKPKHSSTVRQDRLVSTKNNANISHDALSASKVLVMYEDKRKEEMQKRSSRRIAAYEAQDEKQKRQMAAYQAKLNAQAEAKALEVEERRKKLDEEEKAQIAELKQRQMIEKQEHDQRMSLVGEKIRAQEEAEAERKNMIARQAKYVEEIHQCHNKFREIYLKFHRVFTQLSEKDMQALSAEVARIRPLQESVDTLIQHSKDGSINQNDVKIAKNVCAEMSSVYTSVQDYVAKTFKEQEEKELLQQQEQRRVQVQAQQKPDEAPVSFRTKEETNLLGELSDCINSDSLQRYLELKELKEQNEKLFEPLLKDDRLKKFRFDCQKAVNIPVNAISPLSTAHMRDKLQKLYLLLSGQPVAVGEGLRVSASQHPAGIPYCKDLLAKKFVRQGGSTVSSKPEAAFAIASIMVALWQEFPDWGQLVLAHFHQDCPYLVPVFWPQLEGQSNKDYYSSLGYNYNEEGEVEKQDRFLKRMSGIMRLYAAVLISSPPRDRQNRPHPHNISQGWRWLTSLLNLEPRPDICATLIYDFLEVAGSSMSQNYDKQYYKLLLIICKEYLPHLQKIAVSSTGPVVRLQIFLENILKHGSHPPKGMLPSNFW